MIAFVINGCSVFTGYESEISNFNQDIATKNCKNLEYYKENYQKDPILKANQAGSLAQICKDFKLSNKFFDIAENKYKDVDNENLFYQGTKEISKFLLNDNIVDYEGKFFERIMNNYYKALNYLNLKDFSSARVEFNRILHRQERAKIYFANDIKKLQKNLNSQKNELLKDEILQDFLNKNRIQTAQILPNFINPFASYLAAIFFICDKDLNKGENLLRQIQKFYPQNSQISQDLKNINLIANGKKIIWIIYENGKSVGLIDKNFSLPIMINDEILILNFAFAYLENSQKSMNFLQINDKKTKLITDMDEIIKAEFDTTFDYLMSKTIVSSFSKMILQHELSKQTDEISGLVAGLFYTLSNKSDVRYWSYLPQNFQAISLENFGQNFIIKDKYQKIIEEFSIAKNKNAIIYVKDLQNDEKFVSKILF